jgi:non-lysosomal glucosylceramidase
MFAISMTVGAYHTIWLFNCLKDGSFDRDNFNAGPSMPCLLGDTVCAAVSASTWVEPHGRCTVVFALAWSSPKVKFKKGSTYYR